MTSPFLEVTAKKFTFKTFFNCFSHINIMAQKEMTNSLSMLKLLNKAQVPFLGKSKAENCYSHLKKRSFAESSESAP